MDLAELLSWWPLALALVAAGLLTGLLAGLFGVGGGTVSVPVLDELFRLMGVDPAVTTHLAVGTSLAVIIPTSIRSLRGHLKTGAVDRDVLRLWAVPVVLGVLGGAVLAAFVSGAVLKGVFALVTLLAGLRLLVPAAQSWRLGAALPGPWPMRAVGLVIGLLSTLMGIGGGLIGNLWLTLHGVPIHRSVATSSGLGALISIPAALGYVLAGLTRAPAPLPDGSLGYVSWLGVLLIAPLSVLAAPAGVALAHRLSRRRLEVAFGAFQVLIGLRFLVGLFGWF